jgi:hypothetical protein
MARFKTALLTMTCFSFGILSVFEGYENWINGFFTHTPKFGRQPYIASLEAHQVVYYMGTVGLVAMGAFFIVASVYLVFYALLAKSPKSEEIIERINNRRRYRRGLKIPTWLVLTILASWVGVFIYAAVRT